MMPQLYFDLLASDQISLSFAAAAENAFGFTHRHGGDHLTHQTGRPFLKRAAPPKNIRISECRIGRSQTLIASLLALPAGARGKSTARLRRKVHIRSTKFQAFAASRFENDSYFPYPGHGDNGKREVPEVERHPSNILCVLSGVI
jgi:hypothetical protein